MINLGAPCMRTQDLEFLKRLGSDPCASAVVRCKALFTLGLARRQADDREGAARSYRKAIAAAKVGAQT